MSRIPRSLRRPAQSVQVEITIPEELAEAVGWLEQVAQAVEGVDETLGELLDLLHKETLK